MGKPSQRFSKFSQTGSGANDTSKNPKNFDQIEEIIGMSYTMCL